MRLKLSSAPLSTFKEEKVGTSICTFYSMEHDLVVYVFDTFGWTSVPYLVQKWILHACRHRAHSSVGNSWKKFNRTGREICGISWSLSFKKILSSLMQLICSGCSGIFPHLQSAMFFEGTLSSWEDVLITATKIFILKVTCMISNCKEHFTQDLWKQAPTEGDTKEEVRWRDQRILQVFFFYSYLFHCFSWLHHGLSSSGWRGQTTSQISAPMNYFLRFWRFQFLLVVLAFLSVQKEKGAYY